METQHLKIAIFAGGCFWCTEAAFAGLQGVASVMPGYIGGMPETATYREVCKGGTGHREAVKVIYDPARTDYEALLEIFWASIDPTDAGGQFYDRGTQYQTAIFYMDEGQRVAAERSKSLAEQRTGSIIATAILPATTFYAAETEHHAYYRRNSLHYQSYKEASGREAKLKRIWGKGEGESQATDVEN